jgi:predicted TIM-barrel fold metal-dependent hydrolase
MTFLKVDTARGSPHVPVRSDWLSLVTEAALEPELRIIDAHHHLWDRPGNRYLLDEYLEDLSQGHSIEATVFVQCRSMFDQQRQPAFQSVGEVEFANGIAAQSASGVYGATRACAAIVGGADLRLGNSVLPVLEEMVARCGSRLQGVRNTTAWHPDPDVVSNPNPPPAGILQDKMFRQGVGCLRHYDLKLDVWAYHTQLSEVRSLAGEFPDQTIILNHVGGPLGIGQYADRRAEMTAQWQLEIQQLACYPNVLIKLGGLGMKVGGFDLHLKELPPDSQTLASLWHPYVLHCIESFGPERCMFESNFPVDKGMCSYGVLWNAFKLITKEFSATERGALFSGTAAGTYNIKLSGDA